MSRKNRTKKAKTPRGQVVVAEVVTPRPRRRTTRNRKRRSVRRITGGLRVSEYGANFLKCALAPYDFPGLKIAGVPDNYGGPSFVMTHRYIAALPAFGANTSMQIVIPPVPGDAFWYSFTGPAGGAYVAVQYSDFTSVFGTPSVAPYGTLNVERFRIISSTVELVPTSPLYTNAGSICAARAAGIEVTTQQGTAISGSAPNVLMRFINGLDDTSMSALAQMPGAYCGHVNDGVFGFGVDMQDFLFTDIWENTPGLYGADAAEPGTSGFVVAGPKMGWGGITPLAINLSNVVTTDTFLIRVSQTVEYVPRASSMLAEVAGPSPNDDPLAMKLYTEAARKMPAFVACRHNAGFWDLFLRIIGGIAGFAGAIIPNPVAKAAGGLISIGASLVRGMLPSNRRSPRDIELD